jgi:hypothetical protein
MIAVEKPTWTHSQFHSGSTFLKKKIEIIYAFQIPAHLLTKSIPNLVETVAFVHQEMDFYPV